MRRIFKIDNKWKGLFLGLLAINLIAACILIYWTTRPIKDEESLNKLATNDEKVEIPFTSNKEDLNRIINYYIEEESSDSPIKYEVLLKESLELYGTLSAFGRNVEIKVLFEPVTLENGDLLLKHEAIQIGGMSLPATFVLNYINEKYDTPEWVMIRPKEKNIYLALSQMDLKSGITVKAKSFDLKNDEIKLSLLVPVE
ncbi:DUF2140 family protein [Pradoshia sp. D12]|uniref:YpmS family protein n=1 Tax=Bacillaceae TaxID=186817 RepID=UPI00080AE257|nr:MULTISPECIES: YpmS family protein [Bacillaceae]OCA83462.1 hypothetical protein A8L44_11535 [Bacillus sp. FJAT-27986]QFK71703.1 DUF2140 family protein [Pradoshia sp. D12]TPF73498.1 DUF2140 family protein [Bacillus sp. D12]